MITGNEPAFGLQNFHYQNGEQGLTILQHFASMAMQGLLSNPEHRKIYKGESYLMQSDIYAKQAVECAKALIAALNKISEPVSDDRGKDSNEHYGVTLEK